MTASKLGCVMGEGVNEGIRLSIMRDESDLKEVRDAPAGVGRLLDSMSGGAIQAIGPSIERRLSDTLF